VSRVTLDERKAPDASNDPPVSISSASTVLHSGNASVSNHGKHVTLNISTQRTTSEGTVQPDSFLQTR